MGLDYSGCKQKLEGSNLKNYSEEPVRETQSCYICLRCVKSVSLLICVSSWLSNLHLTPTQRGLCRKHMCNGETR